jgi:hypothetical protein
MHAFLLDRKLYRLKLTSDGCVVCTDSIRLKRNVEERQFSQEIIVKKENQEKGKL